MILFGGRSTLKSVLTTSFCSTLLKDSVFAIRRMAYTMPPSLKREDGSVPRPGLFRTQIFCRRFSATTDVKFLENVTQMNPNRPGGNIRFVRNFFI